MCEISNYPWVFPWQRPGRGDNQTSLTTQRGTGDNLQDNVPYQIRPVIHRSLILRFSLLVSVLSCCQIAYISITGSYPYPNPAQPIVKLYKLIKAVIPGSLSSLLFFEAYNGGTERETQCYRRLLLWLVPDEILLFTRLLGGGFERKRRKKVTL